MQHVKVARDRGVVLVTIGTPESIYLTADAGDEPDAVTREIDSDQSIRVVVFTGGAPGVFIQHYSVQELVPFASNRRLAIERDECTAKGTDSSRRQREIREFRPVAAF